MKPKQPRVVETVPTSHLVYLSFNSSAEPSELNSLVASTEKGRARCEAIEAPEQIVHRLKESPYKIQQVSAASRLLADVCFWFLAWRSKVTLQRYIVSLFLAAQTQF